MCKALLSLSGAILVLAATACSDMMSSFKERDIPLLMNLSGPARSVVAKNAVGATLSTTLRTLDYAPDDTNTIFVAKIGNDTTGTGTRSNPVLTVNKARTLCDAGRQKVMILDSGTYDETGFTMTGNFKGLYAGPGCKPTITLKKNNNFFSVSEIVHETAVTGTGLSNVSSTLLKNGNVFIAYREEGTRVAKYKVLEPVGWTVVKDETALSIAPPILCVAVATLANGNVFYAYDFDYSPSTAKFIILDPTDWHVVKTETSINTCTSGPLTVSVLDTGNVLVAYCDYDDASRKLKFKVLEPVTWGTVKTETIINTAEAWFVSSTLMKNNNILFFYGSGSTGTGRIKIFNTYDWGVVLPETSVTGIKTFGTAATTLQNGDVLLSYNIDPGLGYQTGKYLVIDQTTYSIIVSETPFHANQTWKTSSSMLKNGDIFLVYDDIEFGPPVEKYIVLSPKLNQHILVSSDSVFDGLTFIPTDTAYLGSLIKSTAPSLKARWCDFRDSISSTSDVQSSAISSNNYVDISNCKIFNNTDGINVSVNKFKVNNSQFIYNTGIALHINGSAAANGDITIDHCDFFKNQSGLRLENNSGTREIVKNSIFHDNTQAVNATATTSVSYSVISDPVINIIMGTGAVAGDPFYIDDGISDPNTIDLNIRTLFMGYPADSPALNRADDGRNAGALDVEYVTAP